VFVKFITKELAPIVAVATPQKVQPLLQDNAQEQPKKD
jgi:hypothetical protein